MRGTCCTSRYGQRCRRSASALYAVGRVTRWRKDGRRSFRRWGAPLGFHPRTRPLVAGVPAQNQRESLFRRVRRKPDRRGLLANERSGIYGKTEKKMTAVIATMPQPVPTGQSPEKYFNENYEKLGPTPAYIWFQYSMVLKVQSEKSLPSLQQTLERPTYP